MDGGIVLLTLVIIVLIVVFARDRTKKVKELEEKFDLMYLVNSLLSSNGESKANIEKMLPFTMMRMEKVRQYKNELPNLFKKL